jgi:hypothetical protein
MAEVDIEGWHKLKKERRELEKALKRIEEEYAKNLKNPYIFKPLANALYKVWREVDSKEQKNISND